MKPLWLITLLIAAICLFPTVTFADGHDVPEQPIEKCEGYMLFIRDGHNALSLPFDVEGIDSVSDFAKYVERVNHFYGYGKHRFSTKWDEDLELTHDRGFFGLIFKEQTLCLEYPDNIGSRVKSDMTIYRGMGVYGVPVDSNELQTVADFFNVFEGLNWVSYLNERERSIFVFPRQLQSAIEIPIVGHAAYLISSNLTQTKDLEGEVWRSDNAPAAPNKSRNLTTTWASQKLKE